MAVAMMASCSLKENPDYFTDRAGAFKDLATCRASANSCYMPLNSIYTNSFMRMTEACSDNCVCWSNTLDAVLDVSPAFPRFGSTVWQKGYQGVMYCNFVIAGLEKSPIDESQRDKMLAEAHIMRALYYYLLSCTFGDVPYYTCDIDSKQVQQQVQQLPRTDASELRRKEIDAVKEYIGCLDLVKGGDVEQFRAGAALGHMLIAKMAMWNKDWEVAAESLEILQGLYGDLTSYTLPEYVPGDPANNNAMYDLLWRNPNSPESIFEIQHTYTEGGLAYYGNIAPDMQPQHDTTGTSSYRMVNIEELGTRAVSYSPLHPTTRFYKQVQQLYGSDKRAAYNMILKYKVYDKQKAEYVDADMKNPKNGSKDTRPWIGPKFWCPGMNNGYDSNNYRIFRYADAVLMLSECYTELDNVKGAQDCLNQVRRRAGIEDYVYDSKEGMMAEIRDERSRELFGEFQRKFDLVRWGIWYETMLEYGCENSSLKDNIRPCHRYYPIPDIQVGLSGGALNNDEYKAYGL